jgi:hypothetical protein
VAENSDEFVKRAIVMAPGMAAFVAIASILHRGVHTGLFSLEQGREVANGALSDVESFFARAGHSESVAPARIMLEELIASLAARPPSG